MSSKDFAKTEIDEFVPRLVEACGSDQPVKVAQLLNVSYQAARNYLDGRLPEAKVLRSIAENTPYSINWLLTGEGEKFAVKSVTEEATPVTDQMRTFVRQICLDVFAELFGKSGQVPAPKVVKLTPDKIKEETLRIESAVIPDSDR